MQDCPLVRRVLLHKHLESGEAQQEPGSREGETDHDTRQQIDADHADDRCPEEKKFTRSVATQLAYDGWAR